VKLAEIQAATGMWPQDVAGRRPYRSPDGAAPVSGRL